MANKDKLYYELFQLRDRLKSSGRYKEGKAPIVCTDEALTNIADLRPKKLSDFESIPGIGKTFIEKYGEKFLEVVRNNTVVETEKTVKLDKTATKTLKELEKKLVSINRRNRLLYMPKCASKHGVDLFDPETTNNPYDIIFSNKPYTVCDTMTLLEYKRVAEEQKYHKFVYLQREINKELREHGQNNLYIGFPFVIGRLPGENFDVRAPLALLPMTLERTLSGFTLKRDDTRDPLFNNTLVLAFYKFNNINEELPNEVIEDYSSSTFFNSLIQFYNEIGLTIDYSDKNFKSFKEYKANEFPQFQSGQLFMEPCMVLGNFPVMDNSIQKDFDKIIKSNAINTLLNDLLLGVNDIDYYADAYSGDSTEKDNDKDLELSEHDLVYINELNSSQESVITAIESLDELVVQGPPGTGKSQTITSLIADFVSKDKTVLMVSEKKTALDVVYSRLGPLSRYALLIDDVGNKEAFYQQLNNMVHLGAFHNGTENIRTEAISQNIDAQVERLEKIAKKLYEPGEFGIEPYKFYILSKRANLTDENERNLAKKIWEETGEIIVDAAFADLEKLHDDFENEILNTKLSRFLSLCGDYSWLSNIKPNLSDYDTMRLEEKLDLLTNQVNEWRKKFFLVRLFTKHKIMKDVKGTMTEFFETKDKDTKKLIFKNSSAVSESVKYYSEYHNLKPLYSHLNDSQKSYFNTMLATKELCNDSLELANDEVFNNIIGRHIEKFEKENEELFHDIDDFENIINSLTKLIIRKKELTRKSLEEILSGEIYNLNTSKRSGDFKRQIESKRKWSVNKFVNKFDFELFKSIKIWLLTPEVVSEIIPLQTGVFDLVVFDEASQMYVEKGVPSILRAKKVVVAGDHKQLRPSSLGTGRLDTSEEETLEETEDNAALEEESLLDLARFKYDDVLLNFHYRSKYEELIAFSNYAFYRGRLYVSPNTEEPKEPPIKVIKLENAQWINRSNLEEAKQVVQLLKYIFNTREHNETIGIITFNVTQRDLIDDLIDAECAKDVEFANRVRIELGRTENGEDIGLFVKNIESVQGDERDIIIFSIGYARNENGRIVRQFGWLNQLGGENRLNVAISRARQQVYIITSILPSELQVEDTKNDGPKYLKKYLEYAFAVSDRDKEAAKQVLLSFGDASDNGNTVSFDSDFENQVYDALVSEGYQVDTQVGIGGYSIDLAIKSNNDYILGIECDGKLYHSSKSARERDYHRQKYLESRGWKIHRIWSTNWWKNPKGEIEKINNIVRAIS